MKEIRRAGKKEIRRAGGRRFPDPGVLPALAGQGATSRQTGGSHGAQIPTVWGGTITYLTGQRASCLAVRAMGPEV